MRQNFLQFGRFCLVGGIGLLVNLGVTHAGVVLFNLWYFGPYILGVFAGWTSSFVLNALFTFPEHKRASYGRKYALFISMYAIIFATNAAAVYVLTSLLGVHYLVSITASAIATTLLSFSFNKYVIYKP